MTVIRHDPHHISPLVHSLSSVEGPTTTPLLLPACLFKISSCKVQPTFLDPKSQSIIPEHITHCLFQRPLGTPLPLPSHPPPSPISRHSRRHHLPLPESRHASSLSRACGASRCLALRHPRQSFYPFHCCAQSTANQWDATETRSHTNLVINQKQLRRRTEEETSTQEGEMIDTDRSGGPAVPGTTLQGAPTDKAL